jgi:hypothetical protein
MRQMESYRILKRLAKTQQELSCMSSLLRNESVLNVPNGKLPNPKEASKNAARVINRRVIDVKLHLSQCLALKGKRL